MTRFGPRLCAVLLVAMVVACGTSYAVRHTVEFGDTVVSLSRRYGVSETELRHYNELQDGDRLRPGDVIFIPGVRSERGGGAAGEANSANPPGVIAAVAVPPPPQVSNSPSAAAKNTLGWPVAGKVIRGFGVGDSRGIDIATASDSAVGAAAAGTVTYAGTPAPVYGAIVIVAHPGGLFTVYSQLAATVVSKGDAVSRGQTLGRSGGGGGGRPPHVHFEVRRDERPVDPVLFLPAR